MNGYLTYFVLKGITAYTMNTQTATALKYFMIFYESRLLHLTYGLWHHRVSRTRVVATKCELANHCSKQGQYVSTVTLRCIQI